MQLKKIISGVIAPFPIAAGSRDEKILLAHLHGLEAMSMHSLPGLLRDTVSAAWRLDFPTVCIQTLLGKKIAHIKQFLTTSWINGVRSWAEVPFVRQIRTVMRHCSNERELIGVGA